MIRFYLLLSCLFISTSFFTTSTAQTTSWKGTSSTSWRNADNWTNGIPTAATNAVIGDAAFTGPFQPSITGSAAAKSVTLGGAITATLSTSRNLTVSGDITISGNGTLQHGKNTITLTGNWINNGSYTASSTSSSVVMAGIAQTIGGSVTTTFRKLTVNIGSTVTLARAVNATGSSSLLTVKGTLNPAESPTYLVTAGALTVDANAILKVNAATFAANYTVSGATTLNAGSTVEYSAAGNQTVSNTLTYGILRISGSGTKTLAGNLPALTSSSGSVGNIYVAAGTLDLSTFTANRGVSVAGGTFTVLNGATLRIGGANSFPANYAAKDLGLTSTVEYAGTAQTVAANTYGNLTLSGSSGVVVKTFPATAITIAGNLSTASGTATSVSFAAAAALTISGNVVLGASTTFDGGSFSHTVAGNWTNNGTFTGNTSTVSFTGAGSLISGSGANNFNNLTMAASNISASGATALTIAGNLATTGAGIFAHLSGGTTTFTGTSKTISGTGISLDNVTVTGSISTASSLAFSGNLTVSGALSHTAGIITMSGAAKTISGSGAKSFYALSVTGTLSTSVNFSIASSLDISGSLTATAGTATFTGSASLNGTANLFNVTLNGTALQLSSNAVLGIAGAYAVIAGTLDVTSTTPNTVNFNGAAQSVSGGIYHHLTLSNGNTKTAGAAITTNGNISIGSSTTFSAGNFTNTIHGNWINQGTFTPGTGTIALAGSFASSITGATTFGILTVNKTTAGTPVDLLSNISAATVNMTNGQLLTGANTLTITNTRNGAGIIVGNIQRTHTFAAGTPYAFESPDNTITFSSISVAVPSVTVAVTKGNIADFPFGGAVNRQYNISIPAGTYTAVLRLHYEDDELNGNAEATMPLWDHNGSNWTNAGKTSSNGTSNYVELSGLANIAARWTLSDASNVTRWTGAVNNDWNTAGNWTAVQGSPGAVPGANDIVQIGTAAFTNQPVIATTVAVKSIQLGSAQAVTLTLNSGGSLATSGNISGTWSGNAAHTIDAGAQTITVNGDLVLSDGTAGHIINLNIGSGSVTVTGSVTQSGGAAVVFSGAGTLAIARNYDYSSGTFTAGTGTVLYNGANGQTIAGLSYHHITINKGGGIATVYAALTTAGDLTLQNGTLELQANTTVTGNISIAAGSLVNSENITTSVGGNWTNSGTFNPGNGTVLLNGTGPQTLTATTFANLVVTKSGGTATLTGNAVINGDLTVNTGSLDVGVFAASRSSSGGSFTLGSGASLLAGGTANFPASYALYNLATTSTVNYNGTVAQSVAGIAYGNLIFSNGGATAKTLTAPATVNGDLTINSGATFDAGANSVALGGNWVNNGSFVPATSTLLLNGSAKTITGNTTFNRITVYGSYTVNGSDITYNGLLNITATGSYNAGAGTATVNGDLTNSGSLTSTGITTFTGTTVQTIRFINAVVSNSAGVINFNGNVSPVLNSTSTPTYANLNINNTAGINPSVDWLVLVSFTIGSGAIFNGGTHTHTIRGNFTNNGTVTSSGTLLFNPPVAVNINLGNAFSSTGLVAFHGTGAITLSGNPTFLQDLDIENSHAAGITPPGGWTINGDFTVSSNAIFNAGSNSYTVAGDIESNGTLNGGTSTFTMNAAAGLISGSPGTTFHHFTVAGSITANSNFQVDGNFTNNGVFDASLGELVMTGSTPATIGGTTNPSNIAQLTVNKNYTVPVTLARNIANITSLHITGGVLDAGSFTLSEDAVNNGELTIEDSAALKIGGTNTLPVFTAYTLDTLSTVDYAGSTQTIAANVNYGNLTVSTAGIKTPGAALTIVHDFTLSNGTFAGGAFTHLLGGDWNMTSGTFTNTGTTIQLNGVDSQLIASTGAFNNLTLNKTAGLAALAGNITVNNTLGFTAGKLWLAANNLTMGTSATITGVTAARYVIADGTGSLVQPVTNGGNKSFPVGTAAQYIPAVIALTAGSVTDNFSVSVLNDAWNNGTSGTAITMGAVKATWLINEALAGGSNATITLQWPSVLELPGFNRTAGRLAHYISGNWNYGPGDLAAAGTDPYTITRGGFTSFSPFAVSSFQALPVTWVSLSGKNLGSDNQLSWVTANETGNAYFAVEFSADGISWTEAGRVPGANNTSTEQHYSFLHRAVPYTTTWYRIKQVDINGRYSYSRVIRLTRGQQEGHGFIYVTNPATNKVTALIGSARTYQATLIMVDAAGRVLQKKYIGLLAGSNSIDFNMQGFVPGTYFLQYLDESGNRKVSKFVKQ